LLFERTALMRLDVFVERHPHTVGLLSRLIYGFAQARVFRSRHRARFAREQYNGFGVQARSNSELIG
jgi:hypothetical protein